MIFQDTSTVIAAKAAKAAPVAPKPKTSTRATKRSGVTNRAFAKKFALHLASQMNKWWVKRAGSDFLDEFEAEACKLLASMVKAQRCKGKTLRAVR